MMRIEIASSIQTSSIYGDRRAATSARTGEEKQSVNADAQAVEVNDTLGLGPTSNGTGSVNDAAAHVQSTTPVEETDDVRSSTAEEDLARTEDDLKEFISMLNELSQMTSNPNRIEFMFDPEEEISVIRVVDRESGEIVRRIPPEKLLAAMDHVFDALGIVLDQTA